MEGAITASSRLQLIRGNKSESDQSQVRGCEPLLNVLNGKIQVLIDHVRQLEDRVEHMETGQSLGFESGTDEMIKAGAVKIDHAARRVFVSGREVPLSPTEYRLIYHLAVNSGKVVLHRDLLRRASIHGEVNPTNLKVYIGRLRAKLNRGKKAKCDLKAVRGVGYRLTGRPDFTVG